MCKDNPTICENGGACIQKFNSYECQCTPGFGGKRCKIPTSDCSQGNPCQHGGTCRNSPETGRLQCQCSSGFRGQFCEIDIDECAEAPNVCGNGGACQNLVIILILSNRGLHNHFNFLEICHRVTVKCFDELISGWLVSLQLLQRIQWIVL